MIRDVIDVVIAMFSIMLFFVVIYMILLKLTGHSPTLDQITVALSVGTGILVVKIFYDTGRFSSSIENTQEDVKELKSDFEDLRKEFHSLKLDILELKISTNKDLEFIKTKLS